MRQSQCLYVDVNNQRQYVIKSDVAYKYLTSHCYYSFTGIRTVCVLTPRLYMCYVENCTKRLIQQKSTILKKTVKIKTFINYDTIR